ncbi:Uncharacterised protein [Enterobacter cloacae]|nr:Uncharacterised protein [Enterobacter cloacae]
MASRKEIILKAGYIRHGVSGFKHCQVAAAPYPAYKSSVPRRSGKAQPPPDTKKASTKAGFFNARVSRLFQTGSFTQQRRFVGFFPWEMFTTKVTVCRGFFVDWVQQIQHLNQAVRTQVEELAHQQRQLF